MLLPDPSFSLVNLVYDSLKGRDRHTCTHQARIGIIQSVIQSLPLEYSEKEGVVQLARIRRNKLIHTVFLEPVCICKTREGTCNRFTSLA